MNQEARTRKAYAQHGVTLEAISPTQFKGDSPFTPIGKGKGKFYVHCLSGLWDCKTSGLSGNIQKFCEEKSKLNENQFRGPIAKKLADDRGLAVRSLQAWRFGWDGRNYTYPLAASGKTYDLRVFPLGQKEKGTTGTKLSFSGITKVESDEVWLCEGAFDGVACYEMLLAEDRHTSVYAAPGANVFPDHAQSLFQNKKVRVVYDADEAGIRGTARVQRMIGGIAKEILYVAWPEGLKEGYDLRDFHHEGKTLSDLEKFLSKECPGGIHGPTSISVEKEKEDLSGKGLVPSAVIKRYRKYLYLPNPEVLDVIYGSIFANRLDGDPIWIFLVAPPGGSKTELIMPLSDAPLIWSISSLTPRTLVSGASVSNGDGDPSLLPHLDGRVLSIKDFTTILSMPSHARDEIFGTLREVYDGRFEKAWGTGRRRRYDVKFGIIAGVTTVIEKFGASSSVLGERFIKYRLPQTSRSDAIIDAALSNLNRETEMREELQKTAKEVLNRPIGTTIPTLSKSMRVRIRKLSQWVASLRGAVSRDRYTRQVEFRPTVEVGTRLAKQFAKLGQGIAMYHFKDKVDDGIYQIIISIARGTIPDRVEDLVRRLYMEERQYEERGEKFEGIGSSDLAQKCRLDTPTTTSVLIDLNLLGVIKVISKLREKSRYILSRSTKILMKDLDLYRKEGGWQHAREEAKSQTENARKKEVRRKKPKVEKRRPKRHPKRR